jgi:hypothetical protein
MTSDLPEDLTAGDPGLERLFLTLASPGTASELAGERAALTIFQTNVHPPVNGSALNTAATRAMPTLPVADPAAGRAGGTRPSRLPRLRAAAGNRIRVVAVAAAALLGFAAAAYAQALPAPIQHIAHDILPGAPAPRHQPPTPGPSGPGSAGTTGYHHRGHSPGGSHPAPSGSPGPSRSGSPGPTHGTKPRPSTSPTTSAAGTPVLTAQSGSGNQIPAGTSATITGLLTVGGTAEAGVTVNLFEHSAGTPGWSKVGTAKTNAQGAVTFPTPDLSTNSRFRLDDSAGTVSSPVVFTVVPEITATIKYGPRGVSDYVTVATTDAQTDNVVHIQVFQGGAWVTLRSGLLDANGRYTFTISATNRAGAEIQIVLAATRLHAAATSNQITVGPPA